LFSDDLEVRVPAASFANIVVHYSYNRAFFCEVHNFEVCIFEVQTFELTSFQFVHTYANHPS